jgi:hypothetical protein
MSLVDPFRHRRSIFSVMHNALVEPTSRLAASTNAAGRLTKKHLIGFRRDRREAVFLSALFAAMRWSLLGHKAIAGINAAVAH